MRKLPVRIFVLFAALSLVAACGGADNGPETEARATVTFVQPANGATVTGPDVNISLAVTGVEIAPATDPRPGTGHHHIYINDDVTRTTESIPMDLPNVRHFGTGVGEFALTGLEPGQHRLIAVVADAQHVPLNPLVTDTITITVVAPPE
jgi:hypothetical protein